MSTQDELYQVRLTKMLNFKKAGVDLYPSKYHQTHSIQQALNNFNPDEPVSVSIAGRILAIREHGKSSFSQLQDETGKMQIYFKLDELGEDKFNLLKNLDLGDIIGVEGEVFETHRGEITVLVKNWTFLTKSLHPLPEKWEGLTDKETRLRKRYLDLIVNEESRRVFKVRHDLVREMRSFLNSKNYTEVEVPILQPLYGGANAKPFTTHFNALDTEVYLKIASELYLKRLLVAGLGPVYDISKNFRNEGIDQTHYPEFSMLELYIPYADYQDMMDVIEEMTKYLAQKVLNTNTLEVLDQTVNLEDKWQRIKMIDLINKELNIQIQDLSDEQIKQILSDHKIHVDQDIRRGELIFVVFDKIASKNLVQPTWVYDYPAEISPLSKRKTDNPEIAERFELYIGTKEIYDGWSEMNDPILQRQAFETESSRKLDESEVAQPIDEDFLEAMEYGMPPTAGIGIGIERLTMFFTNTWSIQETILFPIKKNEKLENKEANINAKFSLNKEIIVKYPELNIGVIIVEDAKNSESNEEVKDLLRQVQSEIKEKFNEDNIKQDPKIKIWRDTYNSFKSKPSEYRSSVENLPRMILKGRDLRFENTLVDLYNYISLRYTIPIGGEDLDKIQGSIKLVFADSNEAPIRLIGDTKEEAPYEGEVIYKDDIGAICRRWNWREAERTKLTTQTKNAILVLEALPPVSNQEITLAIDELAMLVKKHTKGKVTTAILNQKNSNLNW